MKKKSLPVFFVGLLMCGCQMKEVINEYNVVPLPVTMSEQQGRFYLNSDVPIVVNASQEVKHIASGLSSSQIWRLPFHSSLLNTHVHAGHC